jgi:hypothetical protein
MFTKGCIHEEILYYRFTNDLPCEKAESLHFVTTERDSVASDAHKVANFFAKKFEKIHQSRAEKELLT